MWRASLSKETLRYAERKVTSEMSWTYFPPLQIDAALTVSSMSHTRKCWGCVVDTRRHGCVNSFHLQFPFSEFQFPFPWSLNLNLQEFIKKTFLKGANIHFRNEWNFCRAPANWPRALGFFDVQRTGRANADDLVDEASAWTCSFAVPVLLFVRFASQFVDKMPRALGHREFGEYVLRCFESHLRCSCGTTHKICLAPYRQHACTAACVHKCIIILLWILCVMRTLAWWRRSA